MHEIQKNSVYIGLLSINYARMIPLSQTTGLTLGGGLINFDGWGAVAESSVLLGGARHFFEPGIMGFYFFVPSEDRNNPDSDWIGGAASLRIGYRYQAPWGLLFRAAANLIFVDQHKYLFPALSIGYSKASHCRELGNCVASVHAGGFLFYNSPPRPQNNPISGIFQRGRRYGAGEV